MNMFGGGEDDDDVLSIGAGDGEDDGDKGGDGAEAEAEDRGDEIASEKDDADALEALAAGDDEQEPEPAKAKPKGPDSVPYQRFREVNDEVRELRDRLARLEGASAKEKPEPKDAPKPLDIDEAEERYVSLVLEGDLKAARDLRKQITAVQMAEVEERATKRVRGEMQQQAQATEMTRFQRAAAELTEKYPALNPAGADADEDAIADVRAFRDAHIAAGKSPTEALKLAVDRVAKLNGWGKKAGPAKAPAVTPAEAKKAEVVKRNADAESRIPPRPKGAGGGASEVDPERLTESQFERLSAEEKRRLRGDIV